MKRLTYWIIGGTAIVVLWQWWINRRTNLTTKQYNDSTKASQKEGAKAMTQQLASFMAPLSHLVDISARVFNGNPIAPILTGDGTVIPAGAKDVNSYSTDSGQQYYFFGANPVMIMDGIEN